MKLFRLNAAKAIFGWPLYSTWNAWIYASACEGWMAKTRTFLTFVPVLFLTTIIWAMLWAAALWLLTRIVF